jgi:hypothetical protein
MGVTDIWRHNIFLRENNVRGVLSPERGEKQMQFHWVHLVLLLS